MIDKRKCLRFDVLLTAICRTADVLRKIKVNNFCKGGIGISSSGLLKKGEDVRVELVVPGDNIPVFFDGEIVWMDESKSTGAGYKGGVRFKRLNNNDRGKILEHIYRKYHMPAKD